MNLEDSSHRPYKKDDSVPVYIHKDSNHPPHIKKGLPHMIGWRISYLSSREEIFRTRTFLILNEIKDAMVDVKERLFFSILPGLTKLRPKSVRTS